MWQTTAKYAPSNQKAVSVLVLALWVVIAQGLSLRDAPIVGSEAPVYLEEWNATNGVITIAGNVPGDVITDLELAGVLEPVLFETNWLQNQDLWAALNWTYKTVIPNVPAPFLLAFDGIKMGAEIKLGNTTLGVATDQFLRYSYSISEQVEEGEELAVAFSPDIRTYGRFMACTGGWDWAPQTQKRDADDAAIFTSGIWKDVYVVPLENVAMTDLVAHVFYLGEYPVEPLVEGDHGGFNVLVTIHLTALSATSVSCTVDSDWGESASVENVAIPKDNSSIALNVSAPASKTRLWWPNGLGAQVLYNLTAKCTSASSSSSLERTTRTGLRLVALVTGNDTDPAWVKNATTSTGSGDVGMLLRVNGAAIWARGGNMIPMDEMEGRQNATAYYELVKSASEARMNIFRVWGGGIYYPGVFYDACDEFGILLYHDMQFAQQGHSPTVDATQEAEFRHQIRRISSHPSLAIVDGCNECVVKLNTSTAIYVTFVLRIVVEEDWSRPVMPSCPSNGWDGGVYTLTGHPTRGPLLPKTNARHGLETHGPYQLGGSEFGMVNGDGEFIALDSQIPLPLKQQGSLLPSTPNVFASEFGAAVMSSFESMSSLLLPSHFGLHGGDSPPDKCTKVEWDTFSCEGGNPMSQRNHPLDNTIEAYFNSTFATRNQTGALAFQRDLFYGMVGQALYLGNIILERRSGPTFGTIVWQLNEIWGTGGWGSEEWGRAGAKGQIVGGRPKPLHYFYGRFLYTDVMVGCSTDLCMVRSDIPAKPLENAVLKIVAVNTITAANTTLLETTFSLPAGPGATTYFALNTTSISTSRSILLATVESSTGDLLVLNDQVFLTEPKNMQLQKSSSSFIIDNENILVRCKNVALFLTLTTQAQGRFSENCFTCLPGIDYNIKFNPIGPLDSQLLKETTRIEDASTYL